MQCRAPANEQDKILLARHTMYRLDLTRVFVSAAHAPVQPLDSILLSAPLRSTSNLRQNRLASGKWPVLFELLRRTAKSRRLVAVKA